MIFRLLIASWLLIFNTVVEARGRCREFFRTQDAPSEYVFKRLPAANLDLYENGWVDFIFKMSSKDETITNIRFKGREIALLVRDGRYKGGTKIVSGFIYDIQLTSVKRIPIKEYLNSLSVKERRALLRTHRFGSNAIHVEKKFDIVITTQSPRYVTEYSSGQTRTQSIGWIRKPSPSTLTTVRSHAIVGSKYFQSY